MSVLKRSGLVLVVLGGASGALSIPGHALATGRVGLGDLLAFALAAGSAYKALLALRRGEW